MIFAHKMRKICTPRNAWHQDETFPRWNKEKQNVKYFSRTIVMYDKQCSNQQSTAKFFHIIEFSYLFGYNLFLEEVDFIIAYIDRQIVVLKERWKSNIIKHTMEQSWAIQIVPPCRWCWCCERIYHMQTSKYIAIFLKITLYLQYKSFYSKFFYGNSSAISRECVVLLSDIPLLLPLLSLLLTSAWSIL